MALCTYGSREGTWTWGWMGVGCWECLRYSIMPGSAQSTHNATVSIRQGVRHTRATTRRMDGNVVLLCLSLMH